MKKINQILKEVLIKIEPPEEDLKIIENSLDDFMEKVEKKIKSFKIDAEVFVGGSYAKKTMIKKDYYDLDIFIRFDKKYKDDEISKLTKNILKGFVNVFVIHGSRDYFRIKSSPSFFIEVIPVIKVRNPKESRNITDLSYSHVKYIKKKIKSDRILDEIKLAKVFCYANNCYGAESYINGFSGYGLELLVYHYGNFLKFVRAISKIKEKEIIDIEKDYKNKQQILMDVNSSKLESPIVLIDPTHKQRNALAALSEETFKKFQKACMNFLKSPSINDFEIKKIDLNKIKKLAKKNKNEFIFLKIHTNKQKGDVAGSKLAKFYKHLEKEINKFYRIKNKGFNYKEEFAEVFFVVKKREKIILNGPNIKDKKNVGAFRKKHKNVFVKGKKIYAREKTTKDIDEFLKEWKSKNPRKIKEMSIIEINLIKN